ncbi:chloride channel protein [Tsukamurella soli]
MATGILAGIAGAFCTALLHLVQHLAFAYESGSLLDGVAHTRAARRVLAPTIGGLLAGLGWRLLRARHGDRDAAMPRLRDAIDRPRPFPSFALLSDAACQVLVVGSGGSIGREAAPRQLAAILGNAATAGWGLSDRERRLLLASAAGAGLAAVYDVPAAGAVYAVCVLLSEWSPWAVTAATVTSLCAVRTATALSSGESASGISIPATATIVGTDWRSWPVLAVSVVAAVMAGTAFSAVMARAAHPRATSALAIAAAGLTVGTLSMWQPALAGNGKSIAVSALTTTTPVETLVVLVLLKPIVTAVFVRAGATAGLLTPSFATGAAAGAVVGLTAEHSFPGIQNAVPLCILAAAAATVSITEGAPLFAAVFTCELVHGGASTLALLSAVSFAAHRVPVLSTRLHHVTTHVIARAAAAQTVRIGRARHCPRRPTRPTVSLGPDAAPWREAE